MYTEKDKKYVYLIEHGNTVKIGISTDPKRRLKQISNTNKIPRNELNLQYAWLCVDASDAEDMIHSCCTKEGLHIKGEWFVKCETTYEIYHDFCADYDGLLFYDKDDIDNQSVPRVVDGIIDKESLDFWFEEEKRENERKYEAMLLDKEKEIRYLQTENKSLKNRLAIFNKGTLH